VNPNATNSHVCPDERKRTLASGPATDQEVGRLVANDQSRRATFAGAAGVAGIGQIDDVASSRFSRMTALGIAELLKTITDRGGQYGDTWETCEWNALNPFGFLSKAESRKAALNVLIDIKYARMGGGFKLDTFVDLAAYLLARIGEEIETPSNP